MERLKKTISHGGGISIPACQPRQAGLDHHIGQSISQEIHGSGAFTELIKKNS